MWCASDWSMETFVEDQIEEIREQVGNDNVLCALSGGVDSSVVAACFTKPLVIN